MGSRTKRKATSSKKSFFMSLAVITAVIAFIIISPIDDIIVWSIVAALTGTAFGWDPAGIILFTVFSASITTAIFCLYYIYKHG